MRAVTHSRRDCFSSACYLSPTWSPDGRHLAYLRVGRYSSELVVSRPDGSQSKEFDEGGTKKKATAATSGRPPGARFRNELPQPSGTPRPRGGRLPVALRRRGRPGGARRPRPGPQPEVQASDGVTAGAVPSLSLGGRYVGFIADDSAAGRACSFGTGMYFRDMKRRSRVPVGVPSGATEELGYDADSPGLSSDGRTLVFASEDPALSEEDANFSHNPYGGSSPVRDIFAYDRVTKAITLVSRRSGATGTAADNNSNLPAISADGRYVAFGTESAT